MILSRVAADGGAGRIEHRHDRSLATTAWLSFQGTVRAIAGLVLCRARPNAPRRTGDDMQRELVERAQSGDHEAFSVLVRTSYPRLYGVANLVLRDRDRAQDAVQDALVLAWRNIRALRDADAWDAWLYRLTLRACSRAARMSRRRDVVELHVEPDRHPVVETDLKRVEDSAEAAGVPWTSGRLPAWKP